MIEMSKFSILRGVVRKADPLKLDKHEFESQVCYLLVE